MFYDCAVLDSDNLSSFVLYMYIDTELINFFNREEIMFLTE